METMFISVHRKKGEICDYYRTKDIINGSYEEIEGTFDFWDPNLFFDEDGRVIFTGDAPMKHRSGVWS